MDGRTTLLTRALALALTLGLSFAVAAQDTTKTKEPPDPPGTSLYMSQLRQLFDAWDTSGDGFLDKQELAVVFRGAGAKPFDYKAKPKPKDDPSSKDDPPKSDSEKDKKDPKATDKKPDYSMYPDYTFLVQLDQNADEMISRSEFLSWARDYAVQLKTADDNARALLRLQQQLATAKPGSKQHKTLEAQLKKQQASIDKLNKSVKAYDAALVKAMKKKS